MALINVKELHTWCRSDHRPIILDASWHLPATKRNAKNEYINRHIPGSLFLDLDLFCQQGSNLPCKITQDKALILKYLQSLGVNTSQPIVFYDNSDLHTSARAYWLLRLWGFPAGFLHILDGGLKAYEQLGLATQTGESQPTTSKLSINFQPRLLKTIEQIKSQINSPKAQVIDLRHPVRFGGGPETRPKLRSGHIPGSFSFPYFACFDKNGYFISFEKIIQRLKDIGIDTNFPIITSCGSGITASILNFILDCQSHSEHALYAGSWAEWGATGTYPGESSLAERPIETCLTEDLIPRAT